MRITFDRRNEETFHLFKTFKTHFLLTLSDTITCTSRVKFEKLQFLSLFLVVVSRKYHPSQAVTSTEAYLDHIMFLGECVHSLIAIAGIIS